jgi:hypothetical protein
MMPKKRKTQKQNLKPHLHIFCEGEKTEPNYFNGYIDSYFPGTKLAPVKKTDKNTPVQLVDVAIAAKKNNPLGDQFWVVYDREASNKYPDALHSKARNKAKSNGIKIAFSNVCFEVWILLHFQTTVKAYDSYHDLYKNSELRTHIPKYDKGVKILFSDEKVQAARKNAENLNAHTKSGANPGWTQRHQWNPYTDVHKLLDAIDEFGEKYINM